MPIEKLAALFEENFTAFGELGASLCVWRGGCEVLSLAGGFKDRAKTEPWTAETPVLFWSATKGLAAACLLHACQEHADLSAHARRGGMAGICAGGQGAR